MAKNISVVGTKDGPAVDERELGEWAKSSSELSETFTSLSRANATIGNLWISGGDSITQSDESASIRSGNTWIRHLAYQSLGSITVIANSGISGRKSIDILNNLESEVLAKKPDTFAMLIGTNDARSSVTLANYAANVKSICEQVMTSGARIVLGTVPPQGMSPYGTPAAPVLTVKTTGGTLGPGTYSYRVSAVNGGGGETLPSAIASVTIESGTTNSIVVTAPVVVGVARYKFFGRVGGSEALLQTNTALWTAQPQRGYVDTGAGTPAGAVATTDASAVAWSATIQSLIAKYNVWLRDYARQIKAPLIDYHALLTDPVTGMFRQGYSFDGIHPSGKAQSEMGALAWQTVKSLVPIQADRLVKDRLNPSNLVANPLFTSALSGSWASSDSGQLPGGTLTSGAKAGFSGNALTVHSSGGGTYWFNSSAITTGFVAGDTMLVGLRFITENFVNGGAQANMQILAQPGNVNLTNAVIAGADESGVWQTKFTIPAGITSFQVYGNVQCGSGDLSIGEATVQNLTTHGLT